MIKKTLEIITFIIVAICIIGLMTLIGKEISIYIHNHNLSFDEKLHSQLTHDNQCKELGKLAKECVDMRDSKHCDKFICRRAFKTYEEICLGK